MGGVKRIINLVNTSDIGRMGKLFSTEKIIISMILVPER